MILNIIEFAVFLIKEFILPFILFMVFIAVLILLLDELQSRINEKKGK